jgi:uncharacterized protein
MGDIQQDPSMEEILASIKRVIAEDGRQPGANRGTRATRASEIPPIAPEDDVLELSEPMFEQQQPEPQDELEEEPQQEPQQEEPDGLVSETAAEASRQALAALSLARERGEVPVGEGPLEAVVRDMLRPMLKDWLDRNLPEIVEELVKREIGRITGKSL